MAVEGEEDVTSSFDRRGEHVAILGMDQGSVAFEYFIRGDAGEPETWVADELIKPQECSRGRFADKVAPGLFDDQG